LSITGRVALVIEHDFAVFLDEGARHWRQDSLLKALLSSIVVRSTRTRSFFMITNTCE
jgi:hypothetical protein